MEFVMFHRTALTAAVALLAAAPVLAGGFTPAVVTPPPATPVVPVTPVIVSTDWSGAYAGAQLGFGRLSSDLSADTEGGEEEIEFLEGDGPLFGVHAGYMFDFGGFVAGAELDWDKSQIAVDVTDEGQEALGAPENLGEISSIARAKLRLGFDAGRVLPYVTAGVARASFDYDDEGAENFLEDTATGNFIGLGASFMVSERLMVSIEGLRHNFGDAPERTEAGEGVFEGAEFDTVVNTLTLRGSFRF
jgi:opacity protein-like surface antigen